MQSNMAKSFLLRLLAGCPLKVSIGPLRKLHETSRSDCYVLIISHSKQSFVNLNLKGTSYGT